MKKMNIILGLLAVIVIGGMNSWFIIDQREQVLVLEFGKVKRVVKDAGLHFKVPFVQNIVRFDKRIQDLNAKPTEVILSGQKRLVVDAFIKYRIADPLEFYKAEKVPGSNRKLLDTHLDSSERQVMSSVALYTLLTG